MFRRKLAGVLASALATVGLFPAVASAQTERVVVPEGQDAYVSEFYYEADNLPVDLFIP